MSVFSRKILFLIPDGDGSGGGASGNNTGNPGDSGNSENPGDSGNNGGGSEKPPAGENLPGEDDPMWSDPAKTKAYVQSLRKENAKYRTEAKSLRTELNGLTDRFGSLETGLKKALGIEENVSPEEQVKTLSQTVDSLEFDNAVKGIAIEQGIQGTKAFNYFKFLLSEASENLEENEEISDEQILGFVKQAREAFSNSGKGSTTVGAGKDSFGNPNPDSGDKITVEQFARMTLAEKGNLYGKNPSLYNTLMAEAREKRLI